MKSVFNSLPNNKILALSKLKAFADDMFNVVQMMQFFLDRVENNVGKGENAGYIENIAGKGLSAFSPFPAMFSKGLFFRVKKTQDLCVNSLPNDKFLDWSKFKAFADDKLNVG